MTGRALSWDVVARAQVARPDIRFNVAVHVRPETAFRDPRVRAIASEVCRGGVVMKGVENLAYERRWENGDGGLVFATTEKKSVADERKSIGIGDQKLNRGIRSLFSTKPMRIERRKRWCGER